MKKIILVWFTVLCFLNLSTCFSPWGSDECLLTINIGSSARSAFVNLENGEYEDFIYTISLKDDKGEMVIETTISGTSITISDIKAGKTYTVSVKGSDDDGLRSFGSESGILVGSGQNTLTVNMYSALELTNENWEIFSSLDSPGNSNRKLYVFLKGDIVATSTIVLSHDVKVILTTEANGRKIKWEEIGSMFTISDGATLWLGEEGMKGTIELTGNDSNTAPLINVNGGTLEMYNNIIISGNTDIDNNNGYYGGGVCVNSNGTFNMYGGKISGNGGNGGGVYVNGGEFNMHSGTIFDNTASGNGGGVYVGSNGIFNMHDEGKIYDNKVITTGNSANGGGVYVGSNGIFNMHSGTISNNQVITTGTSGKGGGVYVGSNGTFNMYDKGKISDNHVTGGSTSNNGGGVYVDGGTFNMYDKGKIYNNRVITTGISNNGGGVYVGSNGIFNMHDEGKISDNHVTDGSTSNNGGGVYVDGGKFNMYDKGEISDNTVTGGLTSNNGGGVCVNSNGEFTMHSGTISNNHVILTGTSSNGGGVAVGSGATFRITDGTIYGSNEDGQNLENTASRGKALYRSSGIAQYGIGSTWNDIPLVNNARETTIWVVNGVLQ